MTTKQFLACPCGSVEFSADTIYHTWVNIYPDGTWNPIEKSFGLVKGSIKCLECGKDFDIGRLRNGKE
jgi:hypothetical protein